MKRILLFFSVLMVSFFCISASSDFSQQDDCTFEGKKLYGKIRFVENRSDADVKIKIVNEKFGRGVFFKMLSGRYRKPKEERRIFMFLDLKASTTIAENLGHYTYSQLIQDCFYDLNVIVRKYDAEIYQYVGDEAVLSWSYKRGIKRNNAVELYFAFLDRITSRSSYYQEKYGLVPEFKAGIHGGTLMVTEVGSVKKEIAYHGDVINTTARIQSQCNAYKASVLISESLLQQLQLPEKYHTQKIDDLLLKGKSKAVTIYSIDMVARVGDSS